MVAVSHHACALCLNSYEVVTPLHSHLHMYKKQLPLCIQEYMFLSNVQGCTQRLHTLYTFLGMCVVTPCVHCLRVSVIGVKGDVMWLTYDIVALQASVLATINPYT